MAGTPSVVLLPLTVESYNGGSQDDSGDWSIQNAIAAPTHAADATQQQQQRRPHCSRNGNNFDLVLRYDHSHSTALASDSGTAAGSGHSDACTLTHIVICRPPNCSDPLSSGVLFLSSAEQPPAIERYAHLYTDCTAERFDSIPPTDRYEHGAVCYFDVDTTQLHVVLTIPAAQGKAVRYIHIRLVRGGETNIDMGRIAAVGYPHVSVDDAPTAVPLEQTTLERLELTPKQWQPGTVQPFLYHFQELLFRVPFMLIHYGDNQDAESLANADNLARIIQTIAAGSSDIAFFTVDRAAIEGLPCGGALRTFLSWDEEDDLHDARVVFVIAAQKMKLMADRDTIATRPQTEDALIERRLMMAAWLLKCIETLHAGDDHSGDQQRDDNSGQEQEEAGAEQEESDDDPFIAALLPFATQAAGGMLIGLLATQQCTSVQAYKAALRSEHAFGILQQLMLNYWDTNWVKLHASTSDGYVGAVYDSMLAAGPFQHLTCLHMFLWEYAANLVRASVEALLRSHMALSNRVDTWQTFLDVVRSLLYKTVDRTQNADDSCRLLRSADELRGWSCAEAEAGNSHHRCHEHPASAPFHEYVMAHWGLRRQAE